MELEQRAKTNMKNQYDKKFIEKIRNILLKKSEGYFYDEEINEYQIKSELKPQNESEIKEIVFNDNNEKENREKDSNLILVKKKVTTHYVPPDLLALKMLLENFGEKVDSDDLSSLSDNELINLKNQIIKNLEEI